MGPIKFIFPSFVLGMWAVCGTGIASGAWTDIHWVALGLAFLGCAIIFVNFVYVFSYGYGISMVLVNGAIMAWRPEPAVLLIGGLGTLYGLRLTAFVHARYRSGSYAGRAKLERGNDVPLPFRLFMWVCCSWLMAFVATPAWVVAGTPVTAPGVLAGAALMLAGLVLESVADQQKQTAKAGNPGGFVTSGLFARTRHPNYTGEIIFQLGLIVVAATAADSAWALAAGVLGPLYIAILMVYAAKDQDTQQAQRYGADPAWQDYRQRTGSLLF